MSAPARGSRASATDWSGCCHLLLVFDERLRLAEDERRSGCAAAADGLHVAVNEPLGAMVTLVPEASLTPARDSLSFHVTPLRFWSTSNFNLDLAVVRLHLDLCRALSGAHPLGDDCTIATLGEGCGEGGDDPDRKDCRDGSSECFMALLPAVLVRCC